MPFRSRLAVCLHQADMIREVRNNFLDADYLASHPPIVMEMKEANDGRPHDVSTMEMRQNAIEAVTQGRSTQMQVQISRAKEMVTVQQEFSEEVVDSTMQRLGHAEDGSRQIIERDRMVHVLNAPSPAATASISIGRSTRCRSGRQDGLAGHRVHEGRLGP